MLGKYIGAKSPGFASFQVGLSGIALAYRSTDDSFLCEYFDYMGCEPGQSTADLLRKMVDKAEIPANTSTSLLLMGGDYQMITIDSPMVEPQGLLEACKWQIMDQLTMPVDEAVIDTFPCLYRSMTNQKDKITVVASHLPWLLQLQKSCQQRGLNLCKITIPELACINLISFLHREPEVQMLIRWMPNMGQALIVIDQKLAMHGVVPKLLGSVTSHQESTFLLAINQMLHRFKQCFSDQDTDNLPILVVPAGDKEEAALELLKKNLNNPVSLFNISEVVRARDDIPEVFYLHGLPVIGEVINAS